MGGMTGVGTPELAAAMSGTTIVLAPAFLARLRFADGDAYTWGKAATCVHGALLGPRRASGPLARRHQAAVQPP